MSYADLRRGRVSLRGHTYLVTTVTAHRQALFRDLFLGRIVVQALKREDVAGTTRTLAFVVMPDHVHWLFELTGSNSLAGIVKRVKGSVARRVNQDRSGQGAVWQPAFHDHALRSDETLMNLAQYVIMNPVRAGLVSRIGDYPLWDAVWVP